MRLPGKQLRQQNLLQKLPPQLHLQVRYLSYSVLPAEGFELQEPVLCSNAQQNFSHIVTCLRTCMLLLPVPAVSYVM